MKLTWCLTPFYQTLKKTNFSKELSNKEGNTELATLKSLLMVTLKSFKTLTNTFSLLLQQQQSKITIEAKTATNYKNLAILKVQSSENTTLNTILNDVISTIEKFVKKFLPA